MLLLEEITLPIWGLNIWFTRNAPHHHHHHHFLLHLTCVQKHRWLRRWNWKEWRSVEQWPPTTHTRPSNAEGWAETPIVTGEIWLDPFCVFEFILLLKLWSLQISCLATSWYILITITLLDLAFLCLIFGTGGMGLHRRQRQRCLREQVRLPQVGDLWQLWLVLRGGV